MNRSLRAMIVAIVVVIPSACVTAPAIAPVPEGAPPAEVRAAELQRECRGARSQMDCYSAGLLEVLEGEGVQEAMLTLERLGERDREVLREGHMYAHAIGLEAAPTTAEVAETFRDCRPSFQSGCYHGVIQSYFAAMSGGTGSVDAPTANGLCADYRSSGADRWLLFQCVHGMGHGLAAITGHHLPSALEGCDLLTDDWEREGCYGGVFMESIVQATTPHHAVGRPHEGHGGGAAVADPQAGHAGHAAPAAAAGADHSAHAGDAAAMGHSADEHAAHLAAGAHAGHDEAAHAGHAAPAAPAATREPFAPLDRSRPLYPCSVLEDRYLTACYQMQTSAILFHNRGDIEATAAACDQAPEKYRGTCYLSLGRDISAITQQDHAAAREACGTGDARYRVYCHIGYVKNLVDLSAEPTDALTYCRGGADPEVKQACYHAVGEEVWVLTDDRTRAEGWCASAESGYREACRAGAGLASWRDGAE